MEVNGILEVLQITEASGRVLHPLDFCVDALARGIGDAVDKIGQDVLQMGFQHLRLFNQPATWGTQIPSMKIVPRRTSRST